MRQLNEAWEALTLIEKEDLESKISPKFFSANRATLYVGDAKDLLIQLPDGGVQLVASSPPYNIGKEYETRVELEKYLEVQKAVLEECVRVLAPGGHLCWQVGNYVENGEVFPLDIWFYPILKELGLKLRNRIVWRIEHGLHAQKRFSGRHETILWFSKDGEDGSYYFDLDAVRVPQKYPGKKAYRGAKAGQYSGNPLGKNPGDVWEIAEDEGDVWEFPNVKNNHVEKTTHPAAFPIELVERLVVALTRPDDLVLDPFLGVGTAGVAALLHDRRAAGAEIVAEYASIARRRWVLAMHGTVPRRPRGKAIYVPSPNSSLLRRDDLPKENASTEMVLQEELLPR